MSRHTCPSDGTRYDNKEKRDLTLSPQNHKRPVGAWERSAVPLALNISVVLVATLVILLVGHPLQEVNRTDFVIEFLSSLTSFVLFVAVCMMAISGKLRFLLLLGLANIQFGRSFDALDEVITFAADPNANAIFSVLGDSLTLLGEILVAAAAIRWVVVSTARANTDPLTQLFNRRYHEQALEKLIHFGGKETQFFALIALDLDNFKIVNDTHGHAAGDLALQHTANILTKVSRQHDVVSRVGGEEFEVLVPVCDHDQAVMIAERIRCEMEANPPPGLETLTASLGVAIFEPGDTIDILRERADQAVYASKKGGKNRVTVAA